MIHEYYRPKTIEEAIRLLKKPGTVLLHGFSTEISKVSTKVNVVDVQDIGLNHISKNSNNISIGSTTTLQEIINCEYFPDSIKSAIKLDAPLNVRSVTTLGNYLVTCSGRSCFTTVLLALDASIQYVDSRERISLTNFLANLNKNETNNLISQIDIPQTRLAFKYISGTPASRPFITTALSMWTNGRVRLSLGGHGNYPILVLDGSFEDDLVIAARNAYSNAGDERATATYRSEMAATLTKRCILEINSNNSLPK